MMIASTQERYMKKCPKCFFEQPPDTYCAQCGVNMETFKPARTPVLRLLLTNWMVHLAVLITIIVSLVIYDRDKKPGTQFQRTSSEQVSYTKNSKSSKEETEPRESHKKTDSTVPPLPKEHSASVSKKTVAAFTISAPEPLSPEKETPQSKMNTHLSSTPIRGLTVSFYKGSRNAIAEMQKDARSLNISGDGMGGVLLKKQIQQLMSSGELKSVARNSYADFQVQQPIVLFKGQRHPTTSKNIGLNFQITPLRKEAHSGSLEVKGWGNLRDNSTEDSLFSSEMTLNANSVSFLVGFLPKDRPFSEEEKALFESDRTLAIYNQPGFWDESLDLIMMIEFTSKP